MLKFCKEKGREGVVLKTFSEDGKPLYAKEKLDLPKPEKILREPGPPKPPPLPESEVMGSIAKVYSELSFKDFKDKSIAMPLIARYVNEEAKKHGFSSPSASLFKAYLRFLEDRNL